MPRDAGTGTGRGSGSNNLTSSGCLESKAQPPASGATSDRSPAVLSGGVWRDHHHPCSV